MHGEGGDEMIYGDYLSSPLTSFSGIMIINWDPSLDSDVTDISDERYRSTIMFSKQFMLLYGN